jgi:type I restriction enzyme R subunit
MAEAQARAQIDKELNASWWFVQDAHSVNLAAGRGVAVREFILRASHGRLDYLLFVVRQPVGTIEAKPAPRVDGARSGCEGRLEVCV